MERLEIIKILADELRYSKRGERDVARLFLREVLLRRDETIYHKWFAAYHLILHWARETYESERILIKKGYYVELCKRNAIILSHRARNYLARVVRSILWDETFSESLLRNVMVFGVGFMLVANFGTWETTSGGNTSPTNAPYRLIDIQKNKIWEEDLLATLSVAEELDRAFMESMRENQIYEVLESGRSYERFIKVTGYYSPIPGQERYATGSYMGDIKLNGRGVLGADETPVFMGMAAGPPHLKYGTKVIIPELSKYDMPDIYTIHDRGSAIVGNRLDIWMGRGEEAMRKAYEISGYYKVIIVEENKKKK